MSIAVLRDRDINPPDRPLRAWPRHTPDSSTESGTAELGTERARRVLVTDDHEGIRQTLSDILTSEGYIVVEAGNGRQAQAILAETPIDVLILDLAMPLMDGIDLLRDIHPTPPVVIIHSAFAYYDEDTVRQQTGSKVFRIMRKPVRPSELLEAVSDAIADLGDA